MTEIILRATCPTHIRRPDPFRNCLLCYHAINVNRMNGGIWLFYNPINSWFGPDAFDAYLERAVP